MSKHPDLTGSSPGTPTSLPSSSKVFLTLLPITLAVFISFLAIGLQMPVLPVYLHETLGMSTLIVGIVIGAQFLAALLSRSWAGNFADMRGAKRAVVAGLLFAGSSGLVYLLSTAFVANAGASTWLVLLGRIMLALGESLIVTGAFGWSIALVGPQNAGKGMVWIGIAMFAAYALGAPLGVLVNSHWGFTGVASVIVLIPFPAMAVISRLRAVAPSATRKTPFYKVLGVVMGPGLGLALSSTGFGLITAFIALLFTTKAWGNASLAFVAFGFAFIAARIFFGHLPDKIGGAKVALVSVAIECLGLLLVWSADTASAACLGAAFTGFGYSLAFPGFGVEAVRRAPPQTRSLAMGAYVAFLDIALGITSPLAGGLAEVSGIASVYLAGAIAVGLAMVVALRLMLTPPLQAVHQS